MNYWRFMLTYICGLAEGAVLIATGDHHWSAWPGVVWLSLPVVVATWVYATAPERSHED